MWNILFIQYMNINQNIIVKYYWFTFFWNKHGNFIEYRNKFILDVYLWVTIGARKSDTFKPNHLLITTLQKQSEPTIFSLCWCEECYTVVTQPWVKREKKKEIKKHIFHSDLRQYCGFYHFYVSFNVKGLSCPPS